MDRDGQEGEGRGRERRASQQQSGWEGRAQRVLCVAAAAFPARSLRTRSAAASTARPSASSTRCAARCAALHRLLCCAARGTRPRARSVPQGPSRTHVACASGARARTRWPARHARQRFAFLGGAEPQAARLRRAARFRGKALQGASRLLELSPALQLGHYYDLPMLSVKACCHELMVDGVPGFRVEQTRNNDRAGLQEVRGGGAWEGANGLSHREGCACSRTLSTRTARKRAARGGRGARTTQIAFNWDPVHPDGRTGARVMAELALGLLQSSLSGLEQRPLSQVRWRAPFRRTFRPCRWSTFCCASHAPSARIPAAPGAANASVPHVGSSLAGGPTACACDALRPPMRMPGRRPPPGRSWAKRCKRVASSVAPTARFAAA